MSNSVKLSRISLLLSGGAFTAFLCTSPAIAQTNSEAAGSEPQQGAGLQEIVVTAQRREENIQRVPIAVSAATAEQLRSAGVTDTSQLAEVVPGLDFTYTAGSTEVRIRGVGTTSFGPGIENPTAVYLDGVYLAGQAGSLFSLANVERVEVLKGPQGTLFGRNATGGLVQIITPDPKFQTQGMARVTYGNYQTGGTDVYLTGGLSDTVAADVSLHYQHQGEGYGVNVNTGNDVNRLDDDLLVRSKVLFTPSERVKFVLAADYNYTHGSAALTLQQKPGLQNVGFFELFFTNRLQPDPTKYLPLINHGGYYDNNATIDPKAAFHIYGVSLTPSVDMGWAEFKSITAYRAIRFNDKFDIDRVPQDVFRFDGIAKWQQFSEELQLSSGKGPLQWTTGLFYFHSKDQYDPFQFLFGKDGMPLLFPNTPFTSAAQVIEDGLTTDSAAAYAQATYEILPETHLTLGGRYTHEKRSVSGTQAFTAYVGAVAIPLVPAGTPFPTPGLGISDSLMSNNVSYRVALDRQLTPDIMAYVSFNTGFKSGGYNLTVPTNPAFLPEKLKAWEVGLKTELFNNRARLNLSAFTYDYRNIQINNFIATAPYISNGAAARISGAEAELLAEPARGLTIDASVAYTHDRFTNYPNADYNYVVPDCDYSNPSSSRVCQASANGNKLPGTPTVTASLGARYEIYAGQGKWGVSSNIYHNSGFFGTTDNDPRIFQPNYRVLNASIFWEPVADKYRLTLWGRNLLGQHYARNVYISSGQVTYQAASPLTWGLTAEARF